MLKVVFSNLSGLRKNAMVAIHHELNRLAGPGHSNWISQVRRRSSLFSESSHVMICVNVMLYHRKMPTFIEQLKYIIAEIVFILR